MGSIGTINNTSQSYDRNDLSSLNDTSLQALRKDAQEQFDKLTNRLEEIARVSETTNMPREYYDTKTNQENARRVLNEIQDEIASRRTVSNATAQGTRVNSYGERTNREITNATYERQQKALAKRIMRFIGGK